MFQNYFKIAWRNLWKHKTDSFINVFGLCLAFTSALLLLLSVAFEFSYDKFNTNAPNIYHTYFQTQTPGGDSRFSNAMPTPLGPVLKQNFPDIKYATRLANGGTWLQYKDKKIEIGITYTDADFFKMFSFPLTSGNTTKPFESTTSMVVNERSAKAVFGEENPIGKTVQIQVDDHWEARTVTALIKDFPDNSTFQYDFIMPFESQSFYKLVENEWNSNYLDLFVQLNPSVSGAQFESKLKPFMQQQYAETIKNMKRDGAVPANDGSYIKLLMQPLLDMHTNTEIAGGQSIAKFYLYMLMTIALLIIAIACINFINLSIGKSFTRSKEIGLRKTLGAMKNQVAMQFWAEAFLVCLVALIVSLIAAYYLVPSFKQLFALNVQQSILKELKVWLAIVGGFLFITLLAGGYPAWQMARLNVIKVLKGRATVGGSNRLRNALISFQFVISVLLIACTLITWQQMNYLRTRPLGYNTQQVISIPITGEIGKVQALNLMRDKLNNSPMVESITGLYDNLGMGTDNSSRTSIRGFDYKNRELRSTWIGTSYDVVKTLGLKLVAGRDFSPEFLTDSSAVLVNEAMAKQIGEKEIIGVKLPIDSAKPLTIIGVVQDYNYKSLKKKIEPLTLVLDYNFEPNYILVRVKGDRLKESMELMKSTWASVSPGGEFKGSFLDENVNRQYRREEKLMQMFSIGASIAIVLSCLGLLAMVILIISQRTKEIGIRKVLGASVLSIVNLISKEFLIMIFIAACIATPIAWYFMNKWLQGFAYQIKIQWFVFVAAGLLTALIAFVTIGWQAVKAALANPVMSIKSE
ncbi:MAG: ABC transporter permease [Chitinophagaceae bacterium]|nr:ABC transporter permease [Chitinophagaceae bacterium]